MSQQCLPCLVNPVFCDHCKNKLNCEQHSRKYFKQISPWDEAYVCMKCIPDLKIYLQKEYGYKVE